MSTFYTNYYKFQNLLEEGTNLRPKQVAEYKCIQQLMLTTLAELHDDLDSPLPAAKTLSLHTDIINALNERVSVVLAHAV